MTDPEQEAITTVPGSWNNLDYVVVRGQIYGVEQGQPGDDPYLIEVDEVPPEYWDRWEDEDDE